MPPNLKTTWRRIRLEICTWLVLSIVLVLTTTILILSLPSLIYKTFVVLLAHFIRPDLTHIMQSCNSYFALENITARAKMNIVVCLVMDRDMKDEGSKLQEFCSNFTSRVMEKQRGRGQYSVVKLRDNDNEKAKLGDLAYPELGQIWTSFMGFFFWKNESHFDIREHIRICDYGFKIPHVCTQKELKKLATRLVSEPWKQNFSPWEILIIPQYKMDKDTYEFEKEVGFEMLEKGDEKMEEKSVVIIRFHHTMGDGKAWLNLLLADFSQSKISLLPPEKLSNSRQKTKTNPWRALFLPFKMPYDLAKNTVESFDKANEWHTREKRSKKYYTAVTSSIPSQFIKDLKNEFRVSYAAVLICAVCGGIRRVMQEAGQKFPGGMAGAMALPLPNHPNDLTIHATAMHFVWPLRTKDATIRLKEIFEDMNSKKRSYYPTVFNILQNVLGIFPNFVRRGVYNKSMSTIGSSLFPGPTKVPQLIQFSIVDSLFFIGIFPGQMGAVITSVVMGGRQRLIVTLDQTLFPSQQQFEKLGGFIDEEFRVLKTASDQRQCQLRIPNNN